MKLKESLISIIIPIYNAEKFLPKCLEALAKQSYDNIEIIAVNDNSKDNSQKILKSFKKYYSSKILILKNKKRYGSAICINRALKKAKGQFVSFINPSDYMSMHRIKKQIEFLQTNPKNVAVGSQYSTVNEKNKILDKSCFPQDHSEICSTLPSSLSIKPETIVINRMLLPKDILYFSTNKYPLIFTEIFVKLVQYGKISNLNQHLYSHRIYKRRYIRKHWDIKQFISLIKVLVKSRASLSNSPSFPSSLPLLKSLLQIQY